MTIVSIAVAGCRKSDPLVPVAGTVKLNNKPLRDATVLFSPLRANAPGPFVGVTDADGRYTLGPVDRPGAGVAAATYAVSITTVKPDEKDPDAIVAAQKEVVPIAFRDNSQRFEVPAAGTKEADFNLKSR